jgi:hypothetical protein
VNDIAALEDVTLVDLSDSEFEIGGVHCRLVHQRDGVWVLVLGSEGTDLGILHRKPGGSWEFTDPDGSRIRQGPDWKPLVEHQVVGA